MNETVTKSEHKNELAAVHDYNAEGRWSCAEILLRYARYAGELGIGGRDLSPRELLKGNVRWVYPVMERVIAGIEAGDLACVRLGVEFIEEDGRFVFGKTLKAKTARVLGRAVLSEEQKGRIRRRVFGMLREGNVPREFADYARLVRRIGFAAGEIGEVERGKGNRFVERWRGYFLAAARGDQRAAK